MICTRPIILSLETTTTNCSVALSRGTELVGFLEMNTRNYIHAEKLHIFIGEILEKSNINISQIDAIAVSKGPGSYTGLRIGVSAAKGLAYGLSKPLIAIPTLDILAKQIKTDGYICAMIDARRMEVFSSVYNSDFQKIRDTKAEIIDENSFEEYLNKSCVLIGTGVSKCKNVMKSENIKFIEMCPSAKMMVDIAVDKFSNETFENVAYFEPYYLKDFVVG